MRSYIYLAGTYFTRTNGPNNVQMTEGDTLTLRTGHLSGADTGYSLVAAKLFEICGSTGLAPLAPPLPNPPPPAPFPAVPPPAPAVPPGHLLYVISTTTTDGNPDCYVSGDGLCVTDGPGNYGNSERCTFAAAQTVVVNAISFFTEGTYMSDEYAPPLMCSNSGRDGHAR